MCLESWNQEGGAKGNLSLQLLALLPQRIKPKDGRLGHYGKHLCEEVSEGHLCKSRPLLGEVSLHAEAPSDRREEEGTKHKKEERERNQQP